MFLVNTNRQMTVSTSGLWLFRGVGNRLTRLAFQPSDRLGLGNHAPLPSRSRARVMVTAMSTVCARLASSLLVPSIRVRKSEEMRSRSPRINTTSLTTRLLSTGRPRSRQGGPTSDRNASLAFLNHVVLSEADWGRAALRPPRPDHALFGLGLSSSIRRGVYLRPARVAAIGLADLVVGAGPSGNQPDRATGHRHADRDAALLDGQAIGLQGVCSAHAARFHLRRRRRGMCCLRRSCRYRGARRDCVTFGSNRGGGRTDPHGSGRRATSASASCGSGSAGVRLAHGPRRCN